MTVPNKEVTANYVPAAAVDVYKRQIPAFMVFSDATLREMVEKKPLSTYELLNISGVGEKKAARYGNAFLRIIEDAVGSRE